MTVLPNSFWVNRTGRSSFPAAPLMPPQHIRLGVGGGAAVNLQTGLDRVSQLLAAWPG